MRTTLTLDRDVAARLERLRKARKTSLKSVVNEALRQGLERLDSAPPPGEDARGLARPLPHRQRRQHL